MWNSPNRTSRAGKRYDIRDLAALVYPLDMLLDELQLFSVAEAVEEANLSRMEKPELIFAIHEVLRALLEEVPVPKGGHPGHHEAVVFELLARMRGEIDIELDDPESDGEARRAAWTSLVRLCPLDDDTAEASLGPLADRGIDLTSPDAPFSPQITREDWDYLLQAGCLASEFLWDEDWRGDQLLDLPASKAAEMAEVLGIDIDRVHGLPHTPTEAEAKSAERYIREVIRQWEAARGPGSNGAGSSAHSPDF